jgi:hypothetical protein
VRKFVEELFIFKHSVWKNKSHTEMEIIKLEDIVAQTTAPRVESMDIKSEGDDSDDSSDDSMAENNNQKSPILYGRPKSGRVWKERKSRYGILCTVKHPGFYFEAYRSISYAHNLSLERRLNIIEYPRSIIGLNQGCRTCYDANTVLVSDPNV